MSTADQRLAQQAKAMTEAVLEENVRVLCRDVAVRYYHTHRAQHSPAGFPDDVLVGNGLMLYRENKTQTKCPSTEQQAWLDDLAAAGCDAGVWRPMDWLTMRIHREVLPLITSPVLRGGLARALGVTL